MWRWRRYFIEQYDNKNIVTIVTKEERIDKLKMKNVQISQELFFALVKYFLLGQEELLSKIQNGLEQKLDTLVMRELYTKYKIALTKEEKEKARKEYLDRRGVPESFRW